jgi:hypothetical protein
VCRGAVVVFCVYILVTGTYFLAYLMWDQNCETLHVHSVDMVWTEKGASDFYCMISTSREFDG